MADNETVRDPHHVRVEFINEVSVCGFLNGNVNLTLTTANFTAIGETVVTDKVVASRLRMDLYVAQQLRDSLTKIIDAQIKTDAAKVN